MRQTIKSLGESSQGHQDDLRAGAHCIRRAAASAGSVQPKEKKLRGTLFLSATT